MNVRATFNNWLTLAIDGKVAIMTIICSELACSSHNNHILTTTYKYAALYWCRKNDTVWTIINVDVGTDVKYEIIAFVTIFNVKLLTFYWVRYFDFKLFVLIFEVIILRVEFLLLYFWWHYVILRFLGLSLLFRNCDNNWLLRSRLNSL